MLSSCFYGMITPDIHENQQEAYYMNAKKKKGKKWPIILIISAVVILAGILIVPGLLAGRNNQIPTNIKTVQVESGTLEKTVTGTGNLATDDTLDDLVIPDGITIDEVLVESGDAVSQGDILATLDPVALRSAIWETRDELDSLDSQLNLAVDSTESAYITTAIAGRIKQILVAEGNPVDQVMAEHQALIVLSIDGQMNVTFKPSTVEGLAAGSELTVTLADGGTVKGHISTISSDQCVVVLTDNGPALDEQVSLSLSDGTTLGTGPLQINQPLSIMGTGGVVKDILKSLNASVNAGTNLIRLEEAPISHEYEALYEQRIETADRLNTLLDYAETNTLTSALTGTIRSVAIQDGEVTGSGTGAAESATGSAAAADTSTAAAGTTSAGVNAVTAASTGDSATTATTAADNSDVSTAAFTVKTASRFVLTVEIDELDILSIALGQQARISVDALSGQDFTGTISEIGETGSSSQGVTTYSVKLDLTEDTAIKSGMNATATISIQKKENILLIPLDALQESGNESFVYMAAASGNYALGEKRTIVTGISDGESVEVTEGLSAGEVLSYAYTSGTENTAFGMPFGNRNATGQNSDSTDAGTTSGQ